MNQDYILKLAARLADRQSLEITDLQVLAEMIKIDEVKKEFLSTDSISRGVLSVQRKARFDLAEKIWGKGKQFWLDLEVLWLKEMREKTGSTQDDGKDDFKDIVSTQILTGLYTLVYNYHLFAQGMISEEILKFYIESTCNNLFQSILKGHARATLTAEGKNLYMSALEAGIKVGGSGLYLPDPAVNLPNLLAYFLPENINQEIYE